MQDTKTNISDAPAEPVMPIDRIRAEQINALYRNGSIGIEAAT